MEHIKALDRRLSQRIREWPTQLHSLMNAATYTGSPGLVTLVGVLGALVMLLADDEALSISFAFASMALLVNTAIKVSLRRARPQTPYARRMRWKTYSFPSGHTFGATVVYGLWAVVAVRNAEPLIDGLVISSTLAVIALIGLSRSYLGAHYFGDVVGGWLIGGSALLVIVWVT